LTKAGHRYVFRYREGQETHILDALVHLAAAPDGNLDWFDVGVLAHQLGKRIGHTAERQAELFL
jgi:hypothetical protein